MLTDKNILLISPEPWNHIFISKHHYAVHLAKRQNRVYFLNPPSSKSEVSLTKHENLFVIDYPGFISGLRFLPRFVQRFFMRREFHRLQLLIGRTFDIVWSFDNSVFFDFQSLPDTVFKISHVVDFNQNFQLARAAQTADICLCTSNSILNRLRDYNTSSFKINHGFSRFTIGSVSLPGTNPIKAVYAGNLTIPFIDWHCIANVVQSFPQVDFIFIGPGKEKSPLSQLEKKKNCYSVGSVDSDLLQSYYAAADILILCYVEDFQSDQLTNPHKMMEYLGSGKMIVATQTAEFKEHAEEELFLMSKRNSDFPTLFGNAITNLEFWNSQGQQEKRIAFAMDNTYEKQIDRIQHIISDEQKIN